MEILQKGNFVCTEADKMLKFTFPRKSNELVYQETFSDLGIQKNVRMYLNEKLDTETREKAKVKVEKYLLEGIRCENTNKGLYDALSYSLFRFDAKKAMNTLRHFPDQYMNKYDAHTTISCAIQTVLYSGDTISDRFHSWFNGTNAIKNLEDKSTTVTANFPNEKNNDHAFFTIKTPLVGNSMGLYHEAVVGFYGLNGLKTYFPTFTYVYGVTNCNSPLIVDHPELSQIISYCNGNSKHNVPYLITENITDVDGLVYPLADFIKLPVATIDVIINILLQIMNALYKAQSQCDYTHYNLHTKNILIHKLKTPISINLSLGGTDILGVTYVATIINYGHSHIRVSSVGLGVFEKEAKQIYATKPNYSHDMYTLLGHMGKHYHDLHESNKENVSYHKLYNFIEYTYKKSFNVDITPLLAVPIPTFIIPSSINPSERTNIPSIFAIIKESEGYSIEQYGFIQQNDDRFIPYWVDGHPNASHCSHMESIYDLQQHVIVSSLKAKETMLHIRRVYSDKEVILLNLKSLYETYFDYKNVCMTELNMIKESLKNIYGTSMQFPINNKDYMYNISSQFPIDEKDYKLLASKPFMSDFILYLTQLLNIQEKTRSFKAIIDAILFILRTHTRIFSPYHHNLTKYYELCVDLSNRIATIDIEIKNSTNEVYALQNKVLKYSIYNGVTLPGVVNFWEKVTNYYNKLSFPPNGSNEYDKYEIDSLDGPISFHAYDFRAYNYRDKKLVLLGDVHTNGAHCPQKIFDVSINPLEWAIQLANTSKECIDLFIESSISNIYNIGFNIEESSILGEIITTVTSKGMLIPKNLRIHHMDMRCLNYYYKNLPQTFINKLENLSYKELKMLYSYIRIEEKFILEAIDYFMAGRVNVTELPIWYEAYKHLWDLYTVDERQAAMCTNLTSKYNKILNKRKEKLDPSLDIAIFDKVFRETVLNGIAPFIEQYNKTSRKIPQARKIIIERIATYREINQYISSVLMDYYSLLRIFGTYKTTTNNICPLYNKNIIVYAGNNHILFYKSFMLKYMGMEPYITIDKHKRTGIQDQCIHFSDKFSFF